MAGLPFAQSCSAITCGEFAGRGTCNSIIIRAMRRGFALISFVTSAHRPFNSNLCSCAYIPMIVIIHAAVAEHIKSVGEKDSPFPWLSVGASVATCAPELTCSSSQCNPPSYLTLHFTMTLCYASSANASSSEFRFLRLFSLFLPVRCVWFTRNAAIRRGEQNCYRVFFPFWRPFNWAEISYLLNLRVSYKFITSHNICNAK